MRKTTEALISRLDTFHSKTSSLQQEADITLAYSKNLPAIKKEEKRLLKEAKDVPESFEHNYEFMSLEEKEVRDTGFRVNLNKLMSIPEEALLSSAETEPISAVKEPAPKRDKQEIPVLLAQGKRTSKKMQRVGQDYQQTVDMMKKFVVEVPTI